MQSPTMQGKRITVYMCGDPFMPGKHVTLNPRQIPEFDTFCKYLTEIVPNRYGGCIRRVYTPNGSEIRALDQIEAGSDYVVATNRYRKLDEFGYKEIPDRMYYPRLPLKGLKKIDINRYIEPVRHPHDSRLRNKSGRCQNEAVGVKGLRLRVHINKVNSVPFRLVNVPSKDKDDIIKVTDWIAAQLCLNPIMKMYKIVSEGGISSNFHEIWRRDTVGRLNSNKDSRHIEFELDEHVLVCPRLNTDLAPMIYYLGGKPNFKTSSPRTGQYNLNDTSSGPRTPYKHGRKLNRHGVLPGIGSNTMSPMSNMSGSQGGRATNRHRNQRPTQPVNYDRDDGVYRAKNSMHTQDAKQVNDSKETHIERPIDEMEAETVEEEDIRHKEKTTPIPPGTELNKQPSKEQKQNADTGIQTKNKEVKKGKRKRDGQKAPVQELTPVLDDEAEMDSVDKDIDKDKDKQEMDVGDSKQVEEAPADLNDDRDVENVPNDMKSDNAEVNQAPLSPAPPKSSEGSGENIRNSQERVGADNGPQRIDEREEDTYNNHNRNASNTQSKDPRSSTPASRGEDRAEAHRKEQREQEEAAAKIQAGFRGRKVREEYSKKKRQMREQNDMRESPIRRDYDDDERQKEKAATTIQASYRGHKVRKGQQVRDSEKNDRENRAAEKIQSGFKGYKLRNEYMAKRGQKADNVVKDVNDNEKKDENNDQEQKDKAAVKIQSSFRGHVARKNYHASKANNSDKEQIDERTNKNTEVDPKEQPSDKENEAAARIQAGFKGFKGRQEYTEKKKQRRQEDVAASKIQASFKGHKTRRTLAEKKKEAQLPDPSESNKDKAKPSDTDLDKAAAKIQSGYRGYKARKEIKTKVIDDGEAESDVDQLPESAIARRLLKNKSQFTQGSKGDTASKIQVCFRAFHFRKVFFEGYTKTKKRTHPETKIRAAFKGYSFRKQIKRDKGAQEERVLKSRAATKIQSHYRGYRTRKIKFYSARQVNKLHAAIRAHITRKLNKIETRPCDNVLAVVDGDFYATVIQSLCRGYMTRQSLRIYSARSSVKSANSLQGPTKSSDNISYWQDTNVKMYSDKTLRQAASRIQSAYQMYIVRNSYALIKEKMRSKQDKAAVKIQSRFRGHLVRKGMIDDVRKVKHESVNERNDHQDRDKIGENHQPGSRPSTGHRSRLSSGRKSSQTHKDFSKPKSRPVSSASKRKHDGEIIKHTVNDRSEESDNKSVSSIGISMSGKERTKDSIDTNKTISTLPSKDSEKSSRREVEKEGESPREIEDDASELSSLTKNANAVCQMQAAFRAYKLRREVSELLGGGGELMDIRQVDRAVSALRKDFKLRSAKVRRLASYQYHAGSPRDKIMLKTDEMENLVKAFTAGTIQTAFRSYHLRKAYAADVKKKHELHEHDLIDKSNYKTEAAKNMALKKGRANVKIEAAFRGYKTRQTERTVCTMARNDPHLDEFEAVQDINQDNGKLTDNQIKAKMVIKAAFKGYCYRNKTNHRQKREAATKIEAAFRGYRTRKTESKLKSQSTDTLLKTDSKTVETTSIKNDPNLDEYEAVQDKYQDIGKITDKQIKGKIVIEAAFKGYCYRNKINHKKKREAATKIEAAFRGYRTRKTESKLKSPSTDMLLKTDSKTDQSTFHVRMHSKVVSKRATHLQAAFAGYQTRKVLISLTRLVEEEHNNESSISDRNLERMGSLSETDDFKLRHKSIAKLQAIEAEKNESNLEIAQKARNAMPEHKTDNAHLKGNQIKLPLIRVPTLHIDLRPKSGTFLYAKEKQCIDGKSKTQPEMYQGQKHPNTNDKEYGIEIFIKRKVAATTIQCYAKGFLVRKKQKETIRLSKESEVRSSSGKSGRSNSRVSFSSKDEKNNPNWVKDEIRARTASIKLEAERRKIIAQKVKQKQASRDEKAQNKHLNQDVVHSTKGLTPILSERLVKESDIKQRENSAAIAIQKVYRGYCARKHFKTQLTGTAELEVEYEEWKQKRIQAAIAIQSSWRGYTVRKELQQEQEDHSNMVQDPFWSSESPPGMLVINIGRSKSEIERANKKYDDCSMIQMVVRASKARRKLQVKLAVRRSRKTEFANIIHASFNGFKRRKERKMKFCAASIQNVVRGFMTRERMQERILMRIKAQHMAATQVQALCRAYIKRTDNAAQKEGRRKLAEAHQAAKYIQSVYRGHSVREELGEKKKEMQTEAAVKIRAGITGLKARVKMLEKKKAASRLVAGYRSYRRRVELRLYKEKMHRERVASTRLQSAFKSYRRRVARRQFVEKMERERVAATRLQSACKSHWRRCKMRAFKEKMARQNKAASVIQSSARGTLARIEFKLLKQLNCRREEASVKIQSIYRGHKDRLSVKKLRHAVEVNNAAKDIIDLLINRSLAYIGNRSASAERIQATVKGYKTRSRMDHERMVLNKKRNRCASQIQAVVRAEQGRVLNEYMREVSKKNHAATKIQSLYRGYAARKEIARERAIIADIDPPFISARTRSGRLLALSLDNVLMKNARAMILFHKKATDLQASFRARKVREGVHDRLFVKHRIIEMTPRRETTTKFLTKEDKAAIMVQKTWRGYSDRKAYQLFITGKRKIWNASASIIQASVRGYKKRKDEKQRRERLKFESKEEIWRKRKEAADIISYAYRALKRRSEKVALRAEM